VAVPGVRSPRGPMAGSPRPRVSRTQKIRQPISPSAAAPNTEVCVPASAVVVAGDMSATLRNGVMR
jgi:hypothetical protein